MERNERGAWECEGRRKGKVKNRALISRMGIRTTQNRPLGSRSA
jgi:hypothetical protein